MDLPAASRAGPEALRRLSFIFLTTGLLSRSTKFTDMYSENPDYVLIPFSPHRTVFKIQLPFRSLSSDDIASVCSVNHPHTHTSKQHTRFSLSQRVLHRCVQMWIISKFEPINNSGSVSSLLQTTAFSTTLCQS